MSTIKVKMLKRTAKQMLTRLEKGKEYRIIGDRYSRKGGRLLEIREVAGPVHGFIRGTEGDLMGKVIRGQHNRLVERKENDEVRLGDVRVGENIFCVAGKYATSSGSSCKVMGREGEMVRVRLKSKKEILLHEDEVARLGVVGENKRDQNKRKIKKAGRNRRLGIRPTVSRNAKNPVDRN